MVFLNENACEAGDEERVNLLVEMADQWPGARQGCQSSLSKSCVPLLQCLERRGRGRERGEIRQRQILMPHSACRCCHSLNEPGATVTGISATDVLQQMCEEFLQQGEWTFLWSHDFKITNQGWKWFCLWCQFFSSFFFSLNCGITKPHPYEKKNNKSFALKNFKDGLLFKNDFE